MDNEIIEYEIIIKEKTLSIPANKLPDMIGILKEKIIYSQTFKKDLNIDLHKMVIAINNQILECK